MTWLLLEGARPRLIQAPASSQCRRPSTVQAQAPASKTSKIQARPVNAGHYMAFKHSISFATDWAANFGCDRFRIMPGIVSKLLCTGILSGRAVLLEPEQTLFSRSGRQFRSAALRRIRFGTCCIVPMPYVYLETGD